MTVSAGQSPIRTVGLRLVPDHELPPWLAVIVRRVDGSTRSALLPRATEQERGPGDVRRSAVLILLADGQAGPDLLLTARATTLRSHAGQPAFPGGKQDGSESAVDTALREAAEETGLDPASVTPVALLPDLFLGPSELLVSPVLAYWHRPGPVAPVDLAETAAVARVSVADLVDPARRGRVRHASGYIGPAFEVADMVVWGFTAGLIERLLDWGGWTLPWDRARFITLPDLADRLPDPEVGQLGDPGSAAPGVDVLSTDGPGRDGNEGGGEASEGA